MVLILLHQESVTRVSVDNIQVSESPSKIQTRLKSVGLNSKNSIVDISNFVMLDLGLPNHIFDANKIRGNISINRLDEPTTFKTLDDQDRELHPGDTVVSDESGPLVIAGIMGGKKALYRIRQTAFLLRSLIGYHREFVKRRHA